jgi:hypothetical protein
MRRIRSLYELQKLLKSVPAQSFAVSTAYVSTRAKMRK